MRGKTGADREISVNTYTGGFTTMLNHHLRRPTIIAFVKTLFNGVNLSNARKGGQCK